jgi:hypothetical protein
MKLRRFMPDMGTSSPVTTRDPTGSDDLRFTPRLNLPQNGPGVLGPDLNRSESVRVAPARSPYFA